MRLPRTLAAVVGAIALMSLAACGSSPTASPGNQMSQPPAPPMSQAPTTPAMSAQFGPACSAVPKDGAGSFEGMAQDPVATAASNNPVLSTLVTAVKQAGLVDTLNGLEGVTVFAPTNDAFAKLPKADLDKVLADKALLTKILTYHVVPKTVTPTDLTDGSFDTVEKGRLTTMGSGQAFTVGTGGAKIVCGNVKTANATVYIIDTVLMPPAA
ncbi:putative surface protein with fasciclin (FAS1) repeats [Kibdelosporangium banguiense]|uniref:Surface protein with fasciclin (FAS1) repeats n=1 Tax=Kibdelosporangium banguiense TaxID=1365924 RepID=A0ABS4TNH1_9PSEU|nr:fasciclin domain-containing protein [Kibdelosporangium banguiense]MBP2325945.1 putative surface protein with fasciclin (FAS1) repeats [Kibdelosporangium banguiense]